MAFRSLRAQLIIGLIVIGAAFTVIYSVVQIKLDYRAALAQIDAEFNIVEASSLPLVTSTLRDGRADSLYTTLRGIINMPSISRAAIMHQNTVLNLAGPLSPPTNSHVRAIPINDDKGHILVIHAPLDPVDQRMFQRIKFILLSNILRIFVAAVFVVFFIDRLIMRHLRSVSEHLRETQPSVNPEPFQLVRKRSNKRDELDELVGAVNQLQQTLIDYDADLREEKNRYYALVENNPEAIWRCQIDPPLKSSWSAEKKRYHLLHFSTLVEANQAARKIDQINPDSTVHSATEPSFFNQALWQALVAANGQLKDFLTQSTSNGDKTRYFSSSVACIEQDGECATVWGITIDITERTEAQKALETREQELQASQQRLAEAQALAHMGHWDYQSATDELRVSEEFSRIYGFKANDPKATWPMLQSRIHQDDLAYVVDALSNPDSPAIGAEHRIIWPGGEVRYVQAVARKHIENNRVTATFGIIIDITDQRRAEEARRVSQQALIESEARMAEAQALAHMGHWVYDVTKDEFSCSDEFFRLYGHKPASFKPNYSTFNKQIHSEDWPRIKKILQEVRGNPISGTFRIIRPDGEIRHIRGTATPFYSGGSKIERVFGISIDITEQIHAESALKSTQELISTAFIASPDGIAFIDANSLCFITSNPSLQRISGYDDEQLKGQPFTILEAKASNSSANKRPLSDHIHDYDEVTDREIEITHKTGHKAVCLISWRTIKLQKRNQKLVFIRDVTQLRALEYITEQQNRQLIHADKLASLGTMVAGVAHEINNPNHIIQMNTDLLSSFSSHIIELLEDTALIEQQEMQFNGLSLREVSDSMPELFDDIKSSCRRIDRIIKDLKNFARPRENAQYLPLDLNHVIEQCKTLIAPALEDKPIQLHYDLSPLPAVKGDSQQLQQVMINLTMNAIDALNNHSSGRIKIKTYADMNAQLVVCSITDNGCGISENNMDQIFDPFFTTKQESGGTGLGLAICFQLVREHGGVLEAKSKQGKSTEIRFYLPILESEQSNTH